MKTRSIVEYLHTTCPNCGSPCEDGAKYCYPCGASLIERSETRSDLDPQFLKKITRSRKADIISTILPIMNRPRDYFTDISIVVLFYLVIAALAVVSIENELLSREFAMDALLGFLLPIVAFASGIYVLFQGTAEENRMAYKDIRKNGSAHPAVVLGYGKGMCYLNPKNGIPGKPALLPCVKVLTKIDDIDMTVVLFIPSAFDPGSHPPGSEITIVGYENQFLVKMWE
ncbi:MAG: zinc ribbon domain-containing protein [Lachnospiraceae bacterium]|nr:zinc ribbon domain-containing protein [Lachnospiraceae bacterium]